MEDSPELPSDVSESKPASWRRQLTLICFVVALAFQLIQFPFSPDIDLLTDPLWQSGRVRDHAALMMRWPALWPLLPLWAFSAVCLGRIVFRVGSERGRRIDRFGVLTGFWVQLHYSAIFGARALGWGDYPADGGPWNVAGAIAALCVASLVAAAVAGAAMVLLVLVTWLAVRGLIALGWRIARLEPSQRFAAALGMVVVLLFAIGLALAHEDVAGTLFLAYWLLPILCAPYVLLGFYLVAVGAVTFRARERLRFGFLELLGAVAWLSAYFAFVGNAVRYAWREYQTLPTEKPPKCYVATAAAKGHPWLVGSWVVVREDGSVERWNPPST